MISIIFNYTFGTLYFHNIFHATLQAAFKSGNKSSNLPNFKILKSAETQIYVLTEINFC